MKNRHGLYAICIALTGVLLAGCGASALPAGNSLSVSKNGTVVQTIVDSFDQSYYDLGELEEMAEEETAAYNGSSELVSFDSAELADGKVYVQMTYADCDAYSGFNDRVLFCGTVAEATAAGYDLTNVLGAAGYSLSRSDIEDMSAHHALVVETDAGADLTVSLYAKILYASASVEISGKKTGYIAPANSSGMAYIIFE